MSDLADAALAEAAKSSPAGGSHGAPGEEGDNKFQKAISAWRSKCLLALNKDCANLSKRHQSHKLDPDPGQHGIGDRSVPARLYSSAEGPCAKDKRLQKIGGLCEVGGDQGASKG